MKQGIGNVVSTANESRGTRLDQAMRHRGITKLSVLAHCVGVSEGAICRWRNQGGMSVNNVVAVCSVLEVSADWLLLGRGAMDWRQADEVAATSLEPCLQRLPADVRELLVSLIQALLRSA